MFLSPVPAWAEHRQMQHTVRWLVCELCVYAEGLKLHGWDSIISVRRNTKPATHDAKPEASWRKIMACCIESDGVAKIELRLPGQGYDSILDEISPTQSKNMTLGQICDGLQGLMPLMIICEDDLEALLAAENAWNSSDQAAIREARERYSESMRRLKEESGLEETWK